MCSSLQTSLMQLRESFSVGQLGSDFSVAGRISDASPCEAVIQSGADEQKNRCPVGLPEKNRFRASVFGCRSTARNGLGEGRKIGETDFTSSNLAGPGRPRAVPKSAWPTRRRVRGLPSRRFCVSYTKKPSTTRANWHRRAKRPDHFSLALSATISPPMYWGKTSAVVRSGALIG
jgi:hypothetical protein